MNRASSGDIRDPAHLDHRVATWEGPVLISQACVHSLARALTSPVTVTLVVR